MTQTPTIFISYSHDSDAHRAFALSLADRLREDGLDCRIDQYVNGFPAEGWQRWMENQIEQADYVLIVCTSRYLQRYRGQDPDGGRGVNFEGVVISQTLYDHYYRNTKFIPVIPEQGSPDHVPLPLKGYTTFTLPQEYTVLYRVLTNQHATPAPPIGEKVKLDNSISLQSSSMERKKDASDTLKAAYIAAAATIVAALIAGFFAWFSPSSMHTEGDCSGIFTGDVNGSITQDCSTKE